MREFAHKALVLVGLASVLALPVSAYAEKVNSPTKKTLDGVCIQPNHPSYWQTKIYIAKPNLASCIASGGRPTDAGNIAATNPANAKKGVAAAK